MNIQQQGYKYLFGPVPSRRLGMSLGIDMVPFKTCSLNCVYCECGATTLHSVERKEYISSLLITEELDRYLASSHPPIDVITFGGSGEPTLNTALADCLKHIKTRYPAYKTALLTNSTLLHIEELRQSILSLDYVLPSLDAVSQEVFERINGPIEELTANTVVEGLKAFAKIYKGILWVEVFIVPGINDSEQELTRIRNVLLEINPTRVQINSLDRPGVYKWVQTAPAEQLGKISRFFTPLPVEIISRKGALPIHPVDSQKSLDAIYQMLKRRPMTIEDLAIAIQKNINEAFVLLDEFKQTHQIDTEIVSGKTFYRVT